MFLKIMCLNLIVKGSIFTCLPPLHLKSGETFKYCLKNEIIQNGEKPLLMYLKMSYSLLLLGL